jgi:hypothetical protein
MIESLTSESLTGTGQESAYNPDLAY